jgi:ribosomal protein S18 acetylase RimI-like enzyme
MTYRQAIAEDELGIARVFLSFRNMKTQEEALESFRAEFDAGHLFLIALDEDKIVGLISATIHSRPAVGLAELDHLAVLPQYQNQGIARKLMSEMLLSLENYYQEHNSYLRKLFLLTHASNVDAQKFYEKLGFTKEAILKDHFYNGIDEVVYSQFFNKSNSD